jgi:hypothetical protein
MASTGGIDAFPFLPVALAAGATDMVDEATVVFELFDPPIKSRDILLARDTIVKHESV